MGEVKLGEHDRMRLSDKDLAKATTIPDHLERIGQYASLGKVVGHALNAYFLILIAEGALPPNP